MKQKPEWLLKKRLEKLRKANIKPAPKTQLTEQDQLLPLEERVRKILQIIKEQNKKTNKMLFLVMYDIEDNRVRTEIAKYLKRKGCIRIQKSVYIANQEQKVFNEIYKTLREIQQMYENHDSILLIPIRSDEVSRMKIIGQKVDVDLILGNRNVLFF